MTRMLDRLDKELNDALSPVHADRIEPSRGRSRSSPRRHFPSRVDQLCCSRRPSGSAIRAIIY